MRFTRSVIRQYLRYDKVEAGILALVQDLFQVEIRPADAGLARRRPRAPRWSAVR